MANPILIVSGLDIEAESYKLFVEGQRRRFVQENETPPRPRTAFDTSRKHWVYRIQQRVWVKFADGREEWSEWMTVVVKYYLREKAAVRAMEKYVSEHRDYYHPRREFRVACKEHSTGEPYRHRRRRAVSLSSAKFATPLETA